jgi:hypothetical protein
MQERQSKGIKGALIILEFFSGPRFTPCRKRARRSVETSSGASLAGVAVGGPGAWRAACSSGDGEAEANIEFHSRGMHPRLSPQCD